MNKKKIKIVIGVAVVAVIGGLFTIKSSKLIDTGKVGVQYTYQNGVKDETLDPGLHFVSPFVKVKEFSVGNEQLILSKDKKEGSKDDDSFIVATSDDANIAISFQMSYRFKPDSVVDTYKNFKGMDGEDIVEQRLKTVLKSRISEVTTKYSLMDIYSGDRSKINHDITKYLNKDFGKEFGIDVIKASIIDVHPDKKLKAAINERVKVLQEKQIAEAEREKVKIQKETEKMQAEADAQIALTKAKADAEKTKIEAEAEAEANKVKAAEITDELIRMKEAEARYKHGWVTVQGADAIVEKEK